LPHCIFFQAEFGASLNSFAGKAVRIFRWKVSLFCRMVRFVLVRSLTTAALDC